MFSSNLSRPLNLKISLICRSIPSEAGEHGKRNPHLGGDLVRLSQCLNTQLSSIKCLIFNVLLQSYIVKKLSQYSIFFLLSSEAVKQQHKERTWHLQEFLFNALQFNSSLKFLYFISRLNTFYNIPSFAFICHCYKIKLITNKKKWFKYHASNFLPERKLMENLPIGIFRRRWHKTLSKH